MEKSKKAKKEKEAKGYPSKNSSYDVDNIAYITNDGTYNIAADSGDVCVLDV